MSKDNYIKKSIDNIELPEGAEERMYKNIMFKAEKEKSANKRNISVYRTIAAAAACLAAAFAVGIFAANRNDEIISNISESSTTMVSSDPVISETLLSETGNDQCVENPFAQTFTLEDIQKWGLDLTVPDGAENITCHIWDDSLADISFTISGSTYYYTVSSEAGDNSGIYDETEEIRNITEDEGTL